MADANRKKHDTYPRQLPNHTDNSPLGTDNTNRRATDSSQIGRKPNPPYGKNKSPPLSKHEIGDHVHNGKPSPSGDKQPPATHQSSTSKEKETNTGTKTLYPRNPGAAPNTMTCTSCKQLFPSRPSLNRHIASRECGDRGTCIHCNKTFNSFALVRQHERRSHPTEYTAANRALKDPNQDSVNLMKIAKIEARSHKLVSIRELVAETGLTENQVRSRRERPIYKEYLDEARKQRQHLAKELMSINPKTRLLTPPASSNKAGTAENHDVTKDPIGSNVTPAKKRPRTTLTPPLDHPTKRTVTETPDPRTTPAASKKRPRPDNEFPPVTKKPTGPSLPDQNNDLPDTNHRTPTPPRTVGHNIRTRIATPPLPLPSRGDSFNPLTPEFTANLIEAKNSLTPSDGELANLIQLALFGTDSQALTAVEAWLNSVGRKPKKGSYQTHTTCKTKDHHKNYQGHGGRGSRATAYKKAQDLFTKNKTGLADIILNNRDLLGDQLTPSTESIHAHFSEVFSTSSKDDTEPFYPKPSRSTFYPITAEEITLTCTKWKNAAPGTDGITVATVKQIPATHLSIIFNTIIGRNLQPASWTTLRTTLVPKDGDRRNPSNWRPISIGSSVQRLLHKILGKRIKNSVLLNQNQRGFIEVDGTLANTILLDHYIGQRNADGKALNVVSLDLRKAFDTVSHSSLTRALKRHDIEAGLIQYIISSLKGCTTQMKVDGRNTTPPIHINRGVKQGDPLSPILFNLVIDELLDELNTLYTGGTITKNASVAAIAFADDIILIHDRQDVMQTMLFTTANFIRNRGMEINIAKSTSMSAAPQMGRKVNIPANRPVFTINNKKIPIIDELNTFRYLGHLYGTSGLNKPSLSNLSFWAECIKRAPLKPDQKLTLVRDHLIPKALYGLQNTKTDGSILKNADKVLRSLIKKILHLPITTPSSFIHSRLRDGGLGIPELRHTVPQQLLDRMANLLKNTSDPTIMELLQGTRTTSTLNRLQKLAGDIPASQLARESLSSGPLTSGIEQSSDNPASRSWISYKPHGWTGRDYVRAIHLKANCLPTVGIPSNPVEQRKCRGGCNRNETLSHVLQGCSQTHYDRIRRHNEIVNKIAQHTKQKGLATEVEPHIRHKDGTLFKPDIAVHRNPNTVIICDVQVSWDSPDALQTSWARKERAYNNQKFLEAATLRWPNKNVTFNPIILGARGIWPRCNDQNDSSLVLPQALKNSCVQSCLKWGSSIHGAFMRRIWRKQDHPRTAMHNVQ